MFLQNVGNHLWDDMVVTAVTIFIVVRTSQIFLGYVYVQKV
jgi:hypothetical protein